MKAFTKRDVKGVKAVSVEHGFQVVDKKTTKSKIAKCRFGISIPLKRYVESTSVP